MSVRWMLGVSALGLLSMSCVGSVSTSGRVGSNGSVHGGTQGDAGAEPNNTPDGSAGSTGGHLGDGGSTSSTPHTDAGHHVDPPPPHQVTACGTGQTGGFVAGKWEEITPPGVSLDPKFQTPAGDNYGVHQFVLDPSNTATIYVGTSAQGIYKSTDCGATWKHINTGRNGDQLDKGRNWAMMVDPQEPNTLYANAGYGPGGLFKSTDGGVNWDQMLDQGVLAIAPYQGFIQHIAMDPTDHLHITVTFHGQCAAPYASTGCLAESLDGGKSWRMTASAESWMEGDGQYLIDSTTWLYGSTFYGLWRTTDSGSNWKMVYQGHASEVYYQAPGGNLYVAGKEGVLKSSDQGASWTRMMNSNSTAITGTGKRLFASWGPCYNADQPYKPYLTANEDDGVWTTLDSPLMLQGGGALHYDDDHKFLYSSNCDGGFWRVYLP